MHIPPPTTEFGTALPEAFGDRGALSRDELITELQRRGVDLGADPGERLEDALQTDEVGLLFPLDGELLAYLPALLDGRTFTHRLTSAEVRHGFLEVDADLQPVSMLTEDSRYQRLSDGSPVTDVLAGFDDAVLAEREILVGAVADNAWLLAPAALAGRAAGDVLGITVRANGFELAQVEPGEPPADLAERLTAVLARSAGNAPAPFDDVLWQLCADDPGLFTSPLPPLGELLDSYGFVHQGEQLAPPGFDFPAWRAGSRAERIQQRHDLDPDEALAVLVFTRLHEGAGRLLELAAAETGGQAPAELDDAQSAVGEADDVVRATLEFLAEPAVAGAVAVETLGIERDGAAALGLLAESLDGRAPRSARPALRWLRGKAHDRLGDVLQAEHAWDSALALDPAWSPALFDLAGIASDRGDAERALSLLRRAGARPDDELVTLLEHFRPVERTDIGRNAPCWCGSGRKYKVCHRNREQAPLADRAAWLYQKSGRYLSDGPWRADVLDLAEIRSAHWTGDMPLWRATQDPLVTDVQLFEGGAFEAFLAERGPLLPDDERLLGEQWLLTERSVYEIETVVAGTGFRARNLRTGDRVDVRERLGSTALRPGTLVCARLVPAGGTVQCFGGMEPLRLHERDALIELLDSEPEAAELVAALSARFAPPELRTTDGDPIAACEAIARSSDPAALAEALDETYERDSDGAQQRWHDLAGRGGMRRLRATITLDGEAVTVETTSEPRFDAVLTVLRRLEPGIEVVSESREPLSDLRTVLDRAPTPPDAALDPADPAVAAALAEVIARYEQAWLDESIPALAGVTPRQAAADPTRREDLLRLLASFPPGGPGQMDPHRLRAALGL